MNTARTIAKTVGLYARKETETMKILLANRKLKGFARPQIAHLVLPTHKQTLKKPKELFFSQRSGINDKRNCIFEYE